MISRTPVFLVFAAALAAPACDPGPVAASQAGRTGRAGQPAAGAASQTTGASATHTPAATRHRRGRLIAGERVMRAPSWPPNEALASELRERLPAGLREAVDRCPVPVLVPADAAALAQATMHSPRAADSYGYALAVPLADRHVSVQASRIATLLPHIGHTRGNRRIRGGDGWYSSNDGIRTASWIEHGVAYSLDLECRDPEGPACSEAALEALVRDLAYVGGAGPVGGAS